MIKGLNSTNLATRPAGVGTLLGVIVMTSAIAIGTSQAQNAATTSSHVSLSGIQSVITHTRDAVQRRIEAVHLWSQRRQLRATKPDALDPIAK
jgi:hypothetical protein